MQLVLKVLGVIAVLFVVSVLGFFFYIGKKSQTMSVDLGVNDAKFLACPNKPNCVSSDTDSSDSEHFVEPIESEANSIARFKKIVTKMGFVIVEESENYLRVECKSGIFGFVDDLEIHFRPELKQTHFRSASRVGHSDMGANRSRVEKIKFEFINNRERY